MPDKFKPKKRGKISIFSRQNRTFPPCPGNSTSLPSSPNATACLCNAGFGGPPGGQLAENKADADAKLAEKLAENKSDIDALLAENKADADAQMAGVIKTLDQLVSGSALRKRTCIKRQYIAYPPDARRQTLQWLLQHSSHPYPTKDEVECLLEQTGLDTIKRMKILIYNVRNRDMQKNAQGVWRQRVAM